METNNENAIVVNIEKLNNIVLVQSIEIVEMKNTIQSQQEEIENLTRQVKKLQRMVNNSQSMEW